MAESRIAVYGAMAANVAIATTKFIVAGLSGSSAMLSEGIHSLVDTGNDALLLVGLQRSQRPASAEHPFGSGKELYFWSLIVAVLIFGLGGGVSFYEGFVHIRDPAPLRDPTWNYVVLGVAALFEGGSFAVAWRQFGKQRGDTPFWRAMRSSKDPSNYTVLAEDGAALAGLAIAALGVFLSHSLQMPMLDGVASAAIGLLLSGVAVLLIHQSRGLLVGEGVNADTARAIRGIVADEGVKQVGPLLSMYVGSEDVLVTFDASFDTRTSSSDVAAAIRRIEQRIKQRFPKVTRIYIEAVGAPSPTEPAVTAVSGAGDAAATAWRTGTGSSSR